jgi:hypothetical protein
MADLRRRSTMTILPDPNRVPQRRAPKKRPTTRRKTVVAELTRIAEEIEALNGQLEALVSRGAR